MRDMVTVAATSSEGMSAAELDALISRLPEAERMRAAGMRLEARRRAFVLGRALLRSAVAPLGGVSPDAVVVRIEPSGRPVLAGSLSDLFVSIAHSGAYVVVAVATRPVGVDVERVRQLARFSQVAARVCSPDELRELAAMGAADRERAFMTVWSRKEAYGKAIGRGIAFPLRSVTVGMSGSTISGATGDWHPADVDVDPRYTAAVVAHGPDWR
ncbi:MAG TPA: 4'-phosphopantetheinyl transferase superfamily protein, partial [Acidothermaceae bacterium]|nr:4'-phosphopantetheinyl transferase superfamily protein [Acidothermaceae bacterium]